MLCDLIDMGEINVPKVFISYSHDSRELEEKVKILADKLIDLGVQTEIDQYTTNPEQGWAQYMLDNILESDYILCVCTEIYKNRFENKEQIGKGLGAKFEGKYITQILYEGEYNKKVLPIFFTDNGSIPSALQPYTHYKLYQSGEFEKLYRYITKQPRIQRPQLGNIISLDGNNEDLLKSIKFGNDIELKKN